MAHELLTTAIGQSGAHLLVFSANYRAQRFYSKHRFEPTGEALVDTDTGLEEQRWTGLNSRDLGHESHSHSGKFWSETQLLHNVSGPTVPLQRFNRGSLFVRSDRPGTVR